MLNIALFGAPGAGKGTQSKLLAEKYNLMYISTGDILRQEIVEGTDVGLQAKDIIEKGGLAPDEIIIEIIENRIQKNPDVAGILFDGFPRTVVQAYILDGLMLRMQTSLMCMLSLDVPKDVLMQRLLDRAAESGRTDDKEDVIRFRLEEYVNKTLSVADYYQQKGKYFPINGVGKIEDIFQRLCMIIEAQSESILVNIVLCGFPGSGKRSHSLLLEKKYDLVHISTGELIRKEIAENTEMGKIAGPYIERGDNVPDEIAIRLIEKKIRGTKHAQGFIFKGFPSTYIQAYILDGLLKKLGQTITCAINLESSAVQCMKRLSLRGKSEEARIYDKDAATILHRLEVYEKNSPKVLDYYANLGILHNVKDVNNVEKSLVDVCRIVDATIKKVK